MSNLLDSIRLHCMYLGTVLWPGLNVFADVEHRAEHGATSAVVEVYGAKVCFQPSVPADERPQRRSVAVSYRLREELSYAGLFPKYPGGPWVLHEKDDATVIAFMELAVALEREIRECSVANARAAETEQTEAARAGA